MVVFDCTDTCHGSSIAAFVSLDLDIMFVQGLGGRVCPGFSVVNSEYIVYHPHQCLPKYEITYEI